MTRVYCDKTAAKRITRFSVFTAKQLRVSTVSMHGKFENEIWRRSPLPSIAGGQIMLGWLILPNCYCMLNTNILRNITSGQTKPIVVVAAGAINTQSIQPSAVRSNTVIGFTQQLLPNWDACAGNDKIIKLWQHRVEAFKPIAAMQCLAHVVIHVSVCRHGQTRYISVLISWGATFRCCQICWLLVYYSYAKLLI